MNTQTRIEAVEVLQEIVELSPDVRLGQLFAHVGFLGEDETGRTLWDLEDAELLATLQRHRRELMARTLASDEIPTLETANS